MAVQCASFATGIVVITPNALDRLTPADIQRGLQRHTEGENGTPYQHADKQVSGILPQLLNPVEEAEVELLLRDDNYCAQEKFDGKHLLVRKQDDDLEGINKNGFIVGLPQTVAKDLRKLSDSFIPDGESIGDNYHAFDLLEHNGENLRPLACPRVTGASWCLTSSGLRPPSPHRMRRRNYFLTPHPGPRWARRGRSVRVVGVVRGSPQPFAKAHQREGKAEKQSELI